MASTDPEITQVTALEILPCLARRVEMKKISPKMAPKMGPSQFPWRCTDGAQSASAPKEEEEEEEEEQERQQ